jgi:hypothetical protein
MRGFASAWPVAVVLLAGAAPSGATEALPRLPEPITLDGRPDERAWQAVAPLPMVVFEPVWGAAARQRTELRVAHDGKYLYVGARLFDDEPGEVRVGSLYRDRYSGDDAVGIIVDGFNDDMNALWFYATPAGVRGDAAISDDLITAAADWSWNGHWEAAAVQSEHGWSAEMRIPFSTLGFQAYGGDAVMGLSVYRWLARVGERQVWPAVPPRWARAFAKPSKLADVSIHGVRSGRAVYLSPYLLGGYERRPTALRTESRRVWLEPGLDSRLAVTSNLTLDLTANTDFAQVEADDQQINLGRFPLFFPEKRQFFLERADIFSFGWEGDSRLFHSRRIGLRAGEPIRVYGGGRLAGRAGAWDVGLLDMQSDEPGADGPGENLGAIRVRRRLAGNGSSVGAMLTSRLARQGRNLVSAIDADVRVVGDEFLTGKLAWSASSGRLPDGQEMPEIPADDRQQVTWGSRWLLRWQRRRYEGLSYELTSAFSGADYRSDLGFEGRSEVASLGSGIGYVWLLPEGAAFSKVWLRGDGSGYRRNQDGSLESGQVAATLGLQAPLGHELSLTSRHDYEDVARPFRVARLEVPVGRYRMTQTNLLLSPAPSGWSVRPGAGLFVGGFYGGHVRGGSASLVFNPSGHLELGVEYLLNAIRLGMGRAANTQLARLRLQLALDTHASLAVLAQYNDADEVRTINARARYHLAEGTDIWLVYDEGRFSELTMDAPLPVQRSSRAALLKLTYTWAPL